MKKNIVLLIIIGMGVVGVSKSVLADCASEAQPNCGNVPNCTVLSGSNKGNDGSCKSQTNSTKDCWCYSDT
jgi:hypothetical protein